MNFGSLFSGIGGIDLGFEQAGMTCAWQCEINPAARSVLARHWPDVPRHGDIRTVGAHNLAAVDVICGGFPCQDLSLAGNRAGFSGTRSSLFFEMVRITHELRPSFIVWENVPGLLNTNDGRDFAAVLMALDGIGYHGAWTSLDARYFGLAQRRRRTFGVFARSDIGAGRCAEILSLAHRLRWHPAQSRKTEPTVAGTLAPGAHPGGGSDTESGNLIANTLTAHPGRLDANQTYVPDAATVRRLTPTECERLQGFPDGWTAGQADSPRYRQLGNAVAVPVARWIGERIVALNDHPYGHARTRQAQK